MDDQEEKSSTCVTPQKTNNGKRKRKCAGRLKVAESDDIANESPSETPTASFYIETLGETPEDDSKPSETKGIATDKPSRRKKYDCSDCANSGTRRTFSSMTKLDVHRTSQHVQKFACVQCSPTTFFSTKAKYMYHLGAKHPGIVQFICEYCCAVFKLKGNYKAHMVSHNVPQKKRFTCTVCNGTFVNRSGFEAHLKRFPGPHMKQVCPDCGFSFSREKQMKNHRCKKLLLEEAAARLAAATSTQETHEIVALETDHISNTTQVYHAIPVKDGETEEIVMRDISGGHVIRFEIADGVDSSQQMYVTDWNMVAPFVIRDANCQQQTSAE